jgi:hypothetical protein
LFTLCCFAINIYPAGWYLMPHDFSSFLQLSVTWLSFLMDRFWYLFLLRMLVVLRRELFPPIYEPNVLLHHIFPRCCCRV